MLCDCHLHTSHSGDSDAPVRVQAARAYELGMHTICFTDHYDYDAPDLDGSFVFLLDFDRCFSELEAVREEYRGKMRILIGLELGLQLHIKEHNEEIMKKYGSRLDFCIGSSHFMDRMDIYYPDWFRLSPVSGVDESERERYLLYFERTLKRLEAYDCYDSVGHLDYVVRYGPNRNEKYSYEAYREILDEILKLIIRKDKALELNTGGLKYGLGHPNPCEDILKRYRELGGRLITVGSDAHTPEHIGYGFDRAAEILLETGFREYTIFEKHQPVFYPVR